MCVRRAAKEGHLYARQFRLRRAKEVVEKPWSGRAWSRLGSGTICNIIAHRTVIPGRFTPKTDKSFVYGERGRNRTFNLLIKSQCSAAVRT